MQILKNIFSNFKVKLILLIILDIFLIANITMLINKYFNTNESETPTTATIEQELNSIDPELEKVKNTLLEGKYLTSDEKHFTFNEGGSYEGYFTPELAYIEGNYTYSADTLVIEYGGQSVTYSTSYDDNFNIVLTSADGMQLTLYMS